MQFMPPTPPGSFGGTFRVEVVNYLCSLPDTEVADVVAEVVNRRRRLAMAIVSKMIPAYTWPPAIALSENCRQYGVIKSFNASKGYGFIDCPQVKEVFMADVFLHSLQAGDFKQGDRVKFTVGLNEKFKPQAFFLAAETSQSQHLDTNAMSTQSSASASFGYHTPNTGVWPIGIDAQHQVGMISHRVHGVDALLHANPGMFRYGERTQPSGPAACSSQGIVPPPPPGVFKGQQQEGQQEDVSATATILGPMDEDGVTLRRFRGKVKSLQAAQYGFIECKETHGCFKRDVFVTTDLVDSVVESCKVGSTVTFRIMKDPKGQPQARDIRLRGDLRHSSAASMSTTFEDISGLLQEAECSVCQEMLHKPTCVKACGHKFCSPCLSQWLQKSSSWPAQCPMCRADVREVTRDTVLESALEAVLKLQPGHRRPQEELEELDRKDRFPTANYDIDKMVPERLDNVRGRPGAHRLQRDESADAFFRELRTAIRQQDRLEQQRRGLLAPPTPSRLDSSPETPDYSFPSTPSNNGGDSTWAF